MVNKIQLKLKSNTISAQMIPIAQTSVIIPKHKLTLKRKLSANERWILIKKRFSKNGEAIKLERKIDAWFQLESAQRGNNRQLREFRQQLNTQGKNICFGSNCKGQIMSLDVFSKNKNTCLKCACDAVIASHKRNNGQSYQRTIHLLKTNQCCEVCGCDNPILLDFDHIDPTDKLSNISKTNSTRRLLEEVKKTRILCVMCHRLHTQTQWENRKQSWQIDYVNRIKMEIGECIDCKLKVTEDTLVAYDFDHINPTTKLMNISTMISRHAKIEPLKQEIAKCELRCASCHRLRTAKQFNYPLSHKTIIKPSQPHLNEICQDCSGPVAVKGSIRCNSCANLSNRKVKDRPTLSQINLDLIELKSYSGVGRKYNVSCTTIKKWIAWANKNVIDKV